MLGGCEAAGLPAEYEPIIRALAAACGVEREQMEELQVEQSFDNEASLLQDVLALCKG